MYLSKALYFSLPFAIVLFSVLAQLAFGQAQLGVSRLGYVYDASRQALRPMVGFPGAAYLAAPVREDLQAARSSPDSKWHLLQTQKGWELISSESPAEAVFRLASLEEVIWAEDSRSFAVLALSADGFAPEHYSLQIFSLDAGQDWQPGAVLALPSHIPGDAVKLWALEGKAGSSKWVLWISAQSSPIGEEENATEGESALWRIQYSSAEEALTGEKILDAHVRAFALPAQPDQPVYAVATGELGQVVRMENRDGFWQFSEWPLEAPRTEDGDLFSITALRILKGDVLLSAWRAPGEAADVAGFLLRTAPGDEDSLLATEAVSDRLSPLPAKQLWLLQTSSLSGAPVLLYDELNRQVYFVPDGGQL